MVSPILKWAGGKRQLLDELYARFPKEYERYHEPMFGGGALFFELEPNDGTINDRNPRLINFYRQVQSHPEKLIRLLQDEDFFRDPEADPDPSQEFSETNRKGKEISNFYYQQRELFNRRPNGEKMDELKEAARLLYLNRTCFNGLYRENQSGEFNVPIGRYSNPDWVRSEEIRAASRALKGTEIYNVDFRDVLNVKYARVEAGDLVYFDPPYEPMSRTANFTDYSAEGFSKEDQDDLLELASSLRSRDIHVILSNSGVMYEMYEEAGFHVETEGATRSINSDAENRDEVDEIIATTIAPDERQEAGQLQIENFGQD